MPHLTNKFACLADLPSMPALLTEALHYLNDKHNLAKLVDKIGQDPSMTVRILRIANSPFYGMSREIGSLREAIVLLGLNRIRDMLVSICFSKLLPAWHKDFDYRQFYHHSMAVAECSRQLAICSGLNPDLAFTSGLLHDIGRLVIVALFPDEFTRIQQENSLSLLETERRILGFDNLEIGGKAAHHWNFPLSIQEAIEQHKNPPRPDTGKSLGLLVYTADTLISKAKQADESTSEVDDTMHIARDTLNISAEQSARCTESGLQFANQIITLF
ncbi:HDOD domain-containing protein [Methylomicrobium sp. RS1]|jgi:putative nucleotidyltransferase with HDIG domain|uniref:HDOD domain-containing protein n=1 Tax=Candidatus Methylomicrobium oryzae TaxID=2802053 RepID=UPI001923BECC|nr:HDOD domain-containing protein [Methylomicrobium sp. RS1]MBL1264722.1 HDOD domain-containing protein [Methylomicrobium sp. RS1]